MRIFLILSLLFLVSCASAPERNIASEAPIVLGNVDIKQSFVRLFPTDNGHPDLHHFFVELRDSQKALVDVELREITIKDSGKILSAHIRRISTGRYEVEVAQHDLIFKNVNFLIQKKSLRHQLVTLKKPARNHSSIKIVQNENNRLVARLSLKDKNGATVVTQQPPEIIFEGMGEISDPKMVKHGVWEFDIGYPEDNQIMYISVRANGVFFERLLRFQHVEK